MRSCAHVDDFKAAKGAAILRTILSLYIYPTTEKTKAVRERNGHCLECRSTGQLHICTTCQFIACEGADHFKTRQKGQQHFLAVSITDGKLYCHGCNCYVYDEDVETETCRMAARSGVKRRRRWLPDEREAKILRQSKATVVYVEKNSSLGLRGVCNLGNSCFMSSVLQALAHAPVLREYFLSDIYHECRQPMDTCPVRRFRELIQEFYSGKLNPIIPVKLMRLSWSETSYLAGNQQQDAHEFLIAFLTLVHDHLSARNATSTSKHSSIVDLVFKGFVQSTVTCSKCHNVSPTIEMFWDLSLELPSTTTVKVKNATSTAKTAPPKASTPKTKGRSKFRRKNGTFAPATVADHTAAEPLVIPNESISDSTAHAAIQPESSQPKSSDPGDGTAVDTAATTTITNGTQHDQPANSPVMCTPRRASSSSGCVSAKQPAPSTPRPSHTPLFIGSPPQSPPMLSPTLTLPAMVNGQNSDASHPQSLVDCLKRFTRKEHLGSEAKIYCETCKSSQECSKQLRMYETPPIICFHLKRFEQLQLKKKQKKISTFVEFPETLDMSEFMAEHKNPDQRSQHPQWNVYSLFAVVVHKGQLSQGHYTCFIRQQLDEWYRCDDSVVSRATVEEVLNSESYLLLYHRVVMLSEPKTPPSSM